MAQANLRVNEALFQFTNDIYRSLVDLAVSGGGGAAAGGGFAPYDPMQLRPTVLQAQLNIITARNQYHSAWRQLAAALGLPDMCPTQLEGRVDAPVPCFDYKALVARLNKHTDVLTAEVSIQKAKYSLQAAKLVPLPDLDMRVLVQKDFTSFPNQIAHSFVMSGSIPLWDQNRGGIRQAEWLLAQAAVGPDQSRNALIGILAEAYGRYLTARKAVEIVQQQLRDQVRFYKGHRLRWNAVPAEVSFVDLYVAQQALAGFIASYIIALGQQWQAVVDIGNLLQSEDLFCAAAPEPMPPIPDLNHLQPPPPPIALPPGPGALFPHNAPPALNPAAGGPPPGPPGPAMGGEPPTPPPGPLPPPGPVQNLPPPGAALQGQQDRPNNEGGGR